MHGEAAVGVEGEGGALEHQLVLAADEVEIDQRQAALDDAGDRDALTDRELVALVRRGVGDEQDLAAGLEDAFDRIRPPDVLADRHADAHAAKDDRAGRGARREHPLFVEDAVVRQVDLEPDRFDPALGQERHGVVQFAVLDPGQAEQHGGSAVRRLPRQLFAGGAAGLLEGGLQHQVLGRIAGEIELRRQHEVGAERGGLGARLADAIAIARDVADDRGDLRERDDEAVGGRGHCGRLSARREAGQSAHSAVGVPTEASRPPAGRDRESMLEARPPCGP